MNIMNASGENITKITFSYVCTYLCAVSQHIYRQWVAHKRKPATHCHEILGMLQSMIAMIMRKMALGSPITTWRQPKWYVGAVWSIWLWSFVTFPCEDLHRAQGGQAKCLIRSLMLFCNLLCSFVLYSDLKIQPLCALAQNNLILHCDTVDVLFLWTAHIATHITLIALIYQWSHTSMVIYYRK